MIEGKERGGEGRKEGKGEGEGNEKEAREWKGRRGRKKGRDGKERDRMGSGQTKGPENHCRHLVDSAQPAVMGKMKIGGLGTCAVI